MGKRRKATPPEEGAQLTGPAEQRDFDYDAIRAVSKATRLLDVSLTRFAAEATQPLRGVSVHRLRQRMAFKAMRVETPPDLVLSAIEFEFTANIPNEPPVITVTGAALAVYALARGDGDEITEQGISNFAEANGLYHAWPYLRELVGSLTGRLGLGGVLLPIWTPPKVFPAVGEFLDIVFEPSPDDASD